VRRVLSFVFLLNMLASAAMAQTAGVSAEPSEALRLAIAAYDAGDWPEAQRRFEAAHNEAPTARTLRGLGVVAYRQGRKVDAYAYLTRSLVSNAKPLTEELRASVLTLLNELASKLTRVHFQLHPPGAELRIDGAVPTYDARLRESE
jgi:tetratricopeptide (TPR) repeat protein